MKAISVVFGVMLIVLGSTAMAAELTKGTVEFTTAGAFSYQSYSYDGTDLGSETTVNVAGEAAYSVTNHVALSGGLVFQHDGNSPEGVDGTNQSSFGPQAGVRYHFTTSSNIVPFVEGKLGLLAYTGDGYDDASTTLWLPSVGGGMRVMIGESASVNFLGSFVHQRNAGGVEDVSSNDVRFGLGISVFPGGVAMR